jgi:hypothetical protein
MSIFKLSPSNFLLFHSIISRIIFASTQVLATIFCIRNFSVIEQGIYFTFLAILSLQIIFELGVSQVTVFMISRSSEGDFRNLSSPESVRIVKRFFDQYLKIAMFFFPIASFAGIIVIGNANESELDGVFWLVPWIMATFIYTIRFFLIFFESILEGAGGIEKVIKARSVSQIIWIAVFILSSTAEYPLFSLSFSMLCFIICSSMIYRKMLIEIISTVWSTRNSSINVESTSDHQRFQSRVSGTWIASFCISNLPLPIAFALGTPGFAAKLGVAMQFGAVVGVVSAALSSPWMARASALAAADMKDEFLSIFNKTVWLASAAGVLTAVVGLSAIIILQLPYFADFQTKIPGPAEVAPFILSSVIYSYMAVIGLFFRARGDEVFTFPLVLSALVNLSAFASLSYSSNLTVVGWASTTPAVLIILPLSILYHLKLRRFDS